MVTVEDMVEDELVRIWLRISWVRIWLRMSGCGYG